MKSKIVYILVCLGFFAVGVYAWKITHTGRKPIDIANEKTVNHDDFPVSGVLVEVGGEPITTDDLNFEYDLHTQGIFKEKDLEPVPDLGQDYANELSPLKKRLVTELIEHKLLYMYIHSDETFDFDNASRYTECLKEWQESLKGDLDVLKNPENQRRLKTRLCERSILIQYLDEKVYSKIEVTESEIVEYFRNHANEFKRPRRVLIRQIVLPDERSARKVRYQLTRHNFAQKAREYSITPEAEDGGLLGPFAQGDMPPVFDAAFVMGTGQISPILKSSYGFHMLLLVKKFKKEELGLKDATPEIVEILKEKKKQIEYQKWVEQALSSINVSAPPSIW